MASLALAGVRNARADQPSSTLFIKVTDASTGKPIYQAQLTLQFRMKEGKAIFRHAKWFSYTGKTDVKGICKFEDVGQGPIVLMVTATNHQSYGKKLKFDKSNQLIAVKLRKPHALL